jgi:hypothetical protein
MLPDLLNDDQIGIVEDSGHQYGKRLSNLDGVLLSREPQ